MKLNLPFANRFNLFWKYFRSYLTVGLLVFIMLYMTFDQLKKALVDEVILKNSYHFLEAKRIIEDQIVKLRTTSVELSSQSDIVAVPYSIDDDYMKVIKATQLLRTYTMFDNNLDGITLFYNEKELFIQNDTAGGRSENFYKGELNYLGLDYTDWKRRVTAKGPPHLFLYESRGIANKSEQGKVTLVLRFPVTPTINYIKGCIMLHMDLGRILNQTDLSTLGNRGSLYILNEWGEIIISSRGNALFDSRLNFHESDAYDPSDSLVRIDGEDYIYFHAPSDITGWEYVAFFPRSDVLKSINRIQLVFTVAFVVLSLVVVALALLFSYRNTRPWEDMINLFPNMRNHNMSGNELDVIKEGIRRQGEILQSTFLSLLIQGKIDGDEAMDTFFSVGESPLKEADEYVLIVGRLLFSDQELERIRALLIQGISRVFADRVFIQFIDARRMALLFYDPDRENFSSMEKELINVSRRFSREFSGQILFLGSRVFTRLLNVPVAYAEINAIQDYTVTDAPFVWVENIGRPGGMEGYYFPSEVESLLSTLIKMGDVDELALLLKDIKEKNGKIDGESAWYLQQDLVTSLYKTIKDIGGEEIGSLLGELKDLHREKSLDTFLANLSDYLARLCRHISSQRKDQNHRLVRDIIGFLESNYPDSNINLYAIALPFKLTEKSLSRLFKEETGENISSFLEKIRQGKALDLMEKKDLKLEQIAREVGYQNYNTFHKAFRRFYGKSPGEMRKNMG